MFPTRTARFGVALTFKGPLNLSALIFANVNAMRNSLFDGIELGKHTKSMEPIDKNCPCPTCASGMSRAVLHHIVTIETAGAHGNLNTASWGILS